MWVWAWEHECGRPKKGGCGVRRWWVGVPAAGVLSSKGSAVCGSAPLLLGASARW